MISLVDKSKATVIIYKHEYAKKAHTFLTDKMFPTLTDNPTKKTKSEPRKPRNNATKLSRNNTPNI